MHLYLYRSKVRKSIHFLGEKDTFFEVIYLQIRGSLEKAGKHIKS